MNTSGMSSVRGNETLAIVGGSGFLGRALIERLTTSPDRANWEVRSIDMVPLDAATRRPDCFREFLGDASDGHLLGEALRGANVVWIRAAMLGGPPSADVARCLEYCERNVAFVGTILAACEVAGCRRVCFDSSEQVFGDSADTEEQSPDCEPTAGNFYGATKLIAEKLLRIWSEKSPADSPRSVQIMRYSRVRGAETRDVIFHMAAAALAGKPIRIHGNSDHRISFVDVRDVVDANLTALRRSPRFAIDHVSTDRPISLFDLALRVREFVGRATGQIVPIERTPIPSFPSWEPHVVGMRWEESIGRLGLARPRSLDEMIEETIAVQKSAEQKSRTS